MIAGFSPGFAFAFCNACATPPTIETRKGPDRRGRPAADPAAEGGIALRVIHGPGRIMPPRSRLRDDSRRPVVHAPGRFFSRDPPISYRFGRFFGLH